MATTHVIVGAGQAGAWAAVAMRQAGFDGRILLVGDEPHRPYERPPLSKAVLTAPEEPPVLHFHEAARYDELAIELRLGTAVTAIDADAQRLALADGSSLPYDRLLLATGGHARRLAVPGAEHVHLLRTLDDARRLRTALDAAREVVCIGAGVIGLEIASSARARGCAATVLEAAGTVMGRSLSPEGAAYVERLHRDAGVDLRLGAGVEAVTRAPDGRLHVACADGTAVAGDLVVAGIGMDRNLALAETAGLAIDRGILVDEHGATSRPGIYAAGDVAAFLHPTLGRHIRLESWRHAQNHGTAVGRVMAGAPQPYDEVPWFWTDQHGVNLQVAGFPGEAHPTVVREGATPAAFAAFHLDARNVVIGVTAADSPRESRAGQSLIKAGRPVDPDALADRSVPLQRVAGR